MERVRLAALEAAENDPEFAPDVVDRETRALFANIEQAWSADDARAWPSCVGPDLMVEWNRRLDDFARRGWRNEVSILSRARDRVRRARQPRVTTATTTSSCASPHA